jgi:hypothetical protein
MSLALLITAVFRAPICLSFVPAFHSSFFLDSLSQCAYIPYYSLLTPIGHPYYCFPIYESTTLFRAPFLYLSPCSCLLTLGSYPGLFLKPISTGCSHLQIHYCWLCLIFNHKGGFSTFPRNIRKHLDYTASHPDG